MIRKFLIPILFLFVFINILLLGGYFIFENNALLKFKFIMVVNLMLFGMAIVNLIRLVKMDAQNPHAMVRSVMVGSFLKMILFAGSALIYATQKKSPVGYPTLLVSMGLYLIYTWVELGWTKKK